MSPRVNRRPHPPTPALPSNLSPRQSQGRGRRWSLTSESSLWPRDLVAECPSLDIPALAWEWRSVALGVYLLNRARDNDWQAGNAALKNETMGTAAYRTRADANNSLAASLTRTNRVILGLSIGSGALVAAGAALLYVNHTRGHRKSELSFGWGGGAS